MLLGGKFAKPIASRGFVHREHLTDRLNSQFTLIQAAPGCLLTESLAAILEEAGRRVVWLRFGWEDFDPATCLLSLLEAFQTLNEKVGGVTLEKMRRLPGPLQGWPGLFSGLGEEVKECLPGSLTLVLENLHYPAHSPQTLALLGKHFLSALPVHIRVILLSQKDLPHYALPKQPEIVTAKDLRLSLAAIQRLFQEGELISEKESLRQAVRLADGSPVSLAGICKAGQLLGEAYVQDALRRQTTLAGLCSQIARDWLDTLDEGDIQSTGTLLVLGYNHPVIHQSQTGQPTLTPSPWVQQLAGDWVRPRSPWLASIGAALIASPAFRIGSMHAAAEYLCRGGSLIPGIGLFFASSAANRAAECLTQHVDEMLSLGQWELLKAWLERLPESILAGRPRLLHTAGEIKSAQGDLAGAARDFQQAGERYLELDDHAGHITSLLALSTLAARRGEAGEAWSSAQRALQLAQSTRLSRLESSAELQIGLLALQAGDIPNALPHLELARKLAGIAGNVGLLKRINDLHDLALEQEQRQQQRQQQHQRYLAAQQAERTHLQRLQGALQAPIELDGMDWGNQGWLQAPLNLKLGAAISTNGHVQNGKGGLLGKISNWLRRGQANGHHPEENKSPIAGTEYLSGVLPTSLDQSVAKKPSLPTKSREAFVPTVGHESTPVSVAAEKQSAPVVRPRPESAHPTEITITSPTLSAYMLGGFRLVLQDVIVEQLPPGQTSALLKYLIYNHKRRILRDELMELFWPDVEPESARNRLNVTLSKIRKALRHATPLEIILFEVDKYFLNPDLQIWIDVDQFESLLAEARGWEDDGKAQQAIRLLEVAANLYQGDFLAEDIYEEWTVLTREHLRLAHLDVLYKLSRHYFESGQYAACAAICQSILSRDNCREDVHCLLMRCYAHQGQVPLALRQYQVCEQALRQDLDVVPAASTVALYEQLRQREITRPLQDT